MSSLPEPSVYKAEYKTSSTFTSRWCQENLNPKVIYNLIVFPFFFNPSYRTCSQSRWHDKHNQVHHWREILYDQTEKNQRKYCEDNDRLFTEFVKLHNAFVLIVCTSFNFLMQRYGFFPIYAREKNMFFNIYWKDNPRCPLPPRRFCNPLWLNIIII